MNIVIDINHPAHVHFFRNFARGAEAAGHKVMVTASDNGLRRAPPHSGHGTSRM